MKDLPRVGVHPVLSFPDGSLGYQAYVTALGDESPDYSIMVFVRPTFRGAIGMCEIQLGPEQRGKDGALQIRNTGKFLAIIG